MTHRAAGSSRGVPRIWLLPIAMLTSLLGLTAAGVFSRSLVLDLAAWWPGWLLLLLAVVFAGRRRIGRLRLDGLIPVLVAVVLVVFVVAHVNGWALNPSASRYLAGPDPDGYSMAELKVSVDGDLMVRGGSSFLYEVDPLLGAGELGIPSAEERTIEDSISVQLTAPTNPGFEAFSGWEIALSTAPLWALYIGGEIDADLIGLAVSQVDLSGSGRISLGVPEPASQVSVDGAFTIAVPVGSPVTVIGAAQVPATWEQTTDGWSSPVGGIGWVISVAEDSVVSIEER